MSRNRYTNAAFQEGTPEYFMRKADQHYEMAGLARMDRDSEDADRHLKLAKAYLEKAKEVKTQ